MTNPEFDKFDAVMRKVLSVSRTELKEREEKWKRERLREKKKRPKTSGASRASSGRD